MPNGAPDENYCRGAWSDSIQLVLEESMRCRDRAVRRLDHTAGVTPTRRLPAR